MWVLIPMVARQLGHWPISSASDMSKQYAAVSASTTPFPGLEHSRAHHGSRLRQRSADAVAHHGMTRNGGERFMVAAARGD